MGTCWHYLVVTLCWPNGNMMAPNTPLWRVYYILSSLESIQSPTSNPPELFSLQALLHREGGHFKLLTVSKPQKSRPERGVQKKKISPGQLLDTHLFGCQANENDGNGCRAGSYRREASKPLNSSPPEYKQLSNDGSSRIEVTLTHYFGNHFRNRNAEGFQELEFLVCSPSFVEFIGWCPSLQFIWVETNSGGNRPETGDRQQKKDSLPSRPNQVRKWTTCSRTKRWQQLGKSSSRRVDNEFLVCTKLELLFCASDKWGWAVQKRMYWWRPFNEQMEGRSFTGNLSNGTIARVVFWK